MVVPAATSPSNAMPSPPLESGPAHRDQEHDECQRDCDPGNIDDVAEAVVLRRRLEGRRLLHYGDEHDSSIVNEGVRMGTHCYLLECDVAH